MVVKRGKDLKTKDRLERELGVCSKIPGGMGISSIIGNLGTWAAGTYLFGTTSQLAVKVRGIAQFLCVYGDFTSPSR